jgi:hypothetical protein
MFAVAERAAACITVVVRDPLSCNGQAPDAGTRSDADRINRDAEAGRLVNLVALDHVGNAPVLGHFPSVTLHG